MFAGNTIPDGWLLCDGSAISRTTYANLFSAIGTTWGAGNGSTTFNLPNTINRVVQGYSTSGGYRSAGLPNIYGTFRVTPVVSSLIYCDGTFGLVENVAGSGTNGLAGGGYWQGNSMNQIRYDLNAARSSSIYGSSSTVQPPALTMRFIIKY